MRPICLLLLFISVPAFSQSGLSLLRRHYSGNTLQPARSIAVDGSGNCYVTGNISGTSILDPVAGTNTLVSGGGDDIWLAKYDNSGVVLWAFRMGSTGADRARSLALDASGNIYLTGGFSGTVDFDPGAGTSNLVSVGGEDVFVAKYNSSGAYQWAFNIGSTNPDRAYSLKLDASNNVYITGMFSMTMDADPGAGTSNLVSVGGIDAFVAKYDANGNYQWAFQIGGSSTEEGLCLELDLTNNMLYAGGYISSAGVDFDPGAGTASLSTSGTSMDIYLAKYDLSGAYQWAFNLGDTGTDVVYDMKLDTNKDVFLTGCFSATVDFDPGAGTSSMTSAGLEDVFLVKYNSSGAYQWAFKIGGTSSDIGQGLLIDGSDNIYMTGYFKSGGVDFNPGAGSSTLSSSSSLHDIFLARYDAAGAYQWAIREGDALKDNTGYCMAVSGTNLWLGSDSPTLGQYQAATGTYNWRKYVIATSATCETLGIRANADGDIYATFSYYNFLIVGDNNIYNSITTSAPTTAITKHDASGNLTWLISLTGTGAGLVPKAMTLDGAGNVLICGIMNGTIDFNPGAGTNNLTVASGYDIFVAKYDASGNYLWAFTTGAAGGSEFPYSIVTDASNNIYITGTFPINNTDFDPGAGSALLTNAGSNDIFVAKYDANGAYQWAFRVGGSLSDDAYDLAMDASGNLLLIGEFNSTGVDFDPGAGTSSLSAPSNTDEIFVAKYSSAGAFIWAFQLGGSSNDIGKSISTDASDNVYITGYFSSSNVDFDPGAGTNIMSSAGSEDIFVGKYNASGAHQWAFKIGNTFNDYGKCIAVDASGNVYIAGDFNDVTVDFDPGAGSAVLSSASSDLYLAKYDNTGAFQWVNQMGATSTSTQPYDIYIDAENVYVSGRSYGAVDFDPTASAYTATTGGLNGFIARYGSIALPFELLHFEASYTASQAVELDWNILSQYKKIELWHSQDAASFVLLTSGTEMNHFIHTDPAEGYNYYRLRIIDENDEEFFSPVRSIWAGSSATMQVYPNPSSGKIYIASFSGSITLQDLWGNAISCDVSDEHTIRSIDISGLPKGIYIIKGVSGDIVENRKIIVQ